MRITTDVLIIGGGSTGAGLSRDLAFRGIPSVLVEKGDFTAGASGRNHGLLHSGARYAVNDPEAARECIAENRILKRIAPHCIEETGGLFVTLAEDSLSYRDTFLQACNAADIETLVLSREETRAQEPEISPRVAASVRVPDGAIDPFLLVVDNARDAERHGARFLLHTEIVAFTIRGDRIVEARARDLIHDETYTIHPAYVVNATGAWANHILKLAGLQIGMSLSKGSLLVSNRRMSRLVINRCRPPSDGDIIVPNDTVSIMGTTSIPIQDIDRAEVTAPEVHLLIREASAMIPAIAQTRFIRAYAGVRPLFHAETADDDRAISREFTLIDHGARDGLENLVTITGGKLITYRLMAEKTADLLCTKLGVTASCVTRETPLPGAKDPHSLRVRLQDYAAPVSSQRGETICECELIGRHEVEERLREGKLRDLQDILHRTRLAKGTCQGGFCVYRLIGVLADHDMIEGDANALLRGFFEERWRGVRPILWGDAMKGEELIESIYKGVFNL